MLNYILFQNHLPVTFSRVPARSIDKTKMPETTSLIISDNLTMTIYFVRHFPGKCTSEKVAQTIPKMCAQELRTL